MPEKAIGLRPSSAIVGILFGVLVLAAAASATFYAYMERQLANSEHNRYLAHVNANIMRNSSDLLTLMARLYVVTGKPKYETYYRRIREIRDGHRGRPVDDHHIIWDLVLDDPEYHIEFGEPKSWLQLAAEAGYRVEEIAKLEEAYSNSEQLVFLEHAAMADATARQRNLENGGEGFDPVTEQAVVSLFSDEYLEQKARILKPLNDFIIMFETRLSRQIEQQRRYSNLAGYLLLISLGTIAMVLIVIYGAVVKPLLHMTYAMRQGKPMEIDDFGSYPVHELVTLAQKYNDVFGNLRREKARAVERMQELTKYTKDLEAKTDALRRSEAREREKSEGLEIAHEELNMFVRITSHDLAAPIKNIKALSSTLMDRKHELSDAQKDKLIDNLHKCGQRLMLLISDLRAVAKLDARDLERGPVNVEKLFHGAVESYADSHVIKSATYRKKGAFGDFDGFPQLFRQLVENLVGNAILHGAEEAEIRVEHESDGESDSIVFANKCDTGFQFDASVTEPFKRGRNTKVEGTGLGLYICKKISELHSGNMQVSTLAGNEFQVTILIRRI